MMIGGPLTLRGEGVSGRVLEWPSQPGVAQLIMYQQHRLPSADDLRRWSDQLYAWGFQRIRTSALAPVAAHRVESVGFHMVQELVLLENDHPRDAPRPTAATGRLLIGQHQSASDLDHAAFGPGWSLDPPAIEEVRHATPHHRARYTGDTELSAYALTGRDARQGFLQRLAVRPDQQGKGLGRSLVNDCLRWLGRWRVDRVLVNTPVDNHVALGLYETSGFSRLTERLRVFERDLP
ncbi:MAG: GNAT family N-acetyltransferase [Acidobacteria bacterium]|nr:GNAT family N-acetyltransferase [Acidobacteriota bacterium]